MKLIDYLPPVVSDLRDFKEICGAQQPVFDGIHSSCDGLRRQLCVYLADSYGLSLYEKIFDLPSGGTLEQRRERICEKMQGRIKLVHEQVEAAFPDLTVSYGFSAVDYTLSVIVLNDVGHCIGELKKLLDAIVPCNVRIEVYIRYMTHGDMSYYTHGELKGLCHIGYHGED